MKQEIKIEVPKNWSAVTLKKYLELKKDMEAYKEDPEAVLAVVFHHLCDFPVEYIQKLPIDIYNAIKDDLHRFLGKIDLPLQPFIEIDGVEYGFEPNLSTMSYGAYVDISNYESVGIDDKWAEVMSILYRPVTKKQGKLYEIAPYTGLIQKDKFENVGMDVHLGAVFFFKTLVRDLTKDTLNSLMEMPEIPHSIKSILERNGNLIHHLSNLPMETLRDLKKLRNNL